MTRIEEILYAQTELLSELKSQIVSLNDKVETQEEHINRIDQVSLSMQCFSVSFDREYRRYLQVNVIMNSNPRTYSVKIRIYSFID